MKYREIILENLRNAGWNCGSMTTTERKGRAIWVEAAERSDAGRFIVNSDQELQNYLLMGDLALTNMGLGDKAAALALTERAMAASPIEKNAISGPIPTEVLARVAARMGEPDRAVAALQKLLAIPYSGWLGCRAADSCAAPARSDVRSAP